MEEKCLEKGGEAGSMGMVSKGYDKYGKRMYKCEPKKVEGKLNTSHPKKHEKLPVHGK